MPRRLRNLLVVLGALAVGLGLATLAWRGQSSPSGKSSGAERVILFAPNLNEAAWVLGFGSRLVAVTDWCVWPPELCERPSVGGMVDPNLERIAALDPDLLVVQGEATSLRNFAAREAIPTATATMDGDLASVFGGIVELAALLGDASRGEAVADSLRRELARLSVTSPRPPSVMLLLGHDPGRLTNLMVVGPGTYLQDLVRLVGGRGVPSDEGPVYRSYSVEALVAHPPDLLVDLRPGATREEVLAEELPAAARAIGLAGTRVETMVFDGALVPGPRLVETARRLRALLWPEEEGS